jgi:hypothetical protein
MRPRLRTAVRAAVGAAVAAAVGAAGAAGPTVLSPSPGLAAPAYDDTAQVCVESARSVERGLGAFVGELDKVTETANRGDLISAEKSIKDAGTSLIRLANDLRAHASEADAENVKTTLGSLADEFETQGRSLNSLTALQSFDVSRLDSLADRMVVLCGGPTPSGSPASPAESPTASPASPTASALSPAASPT